MFHLFKFSETFADICIEKNEFLNSLQGHVPKLTTLHLGFGSCTIFQK